MSNAETFVQACPKDQFEQAVEKALLARSWSQDQSRLTWSWNPRPEAEIEIEDGDRTYTVLGAAVGPYHIVWLEVGPYRALLECFEALEGGLSVEILQEAFENWDDD